MSSVARGPTSPSVVLIWLDSGTFLDTADAARRESRNRHRARSLASQMSPDGPLGVRRRESAGLSLQGTSHRSLSPCPTSTSVSATASESVAPVDFRLRRSGRRAASVPIDLALLGLLGLDYQPGVLQSVWVATQEYPASPTMQECY